MPSNLPQVALDTDALVVKPPSVVKMYMPMTEIAFKEARTADSDVQEGSLIGAGWASVENVDLEGEVVLASAWSKTFDDSIAKGRYWLNHDRERPIGRVRNSRLVTEGSQKGIYHDRIVLPPTENNKNWLFPLLLEGAINEHSVGFFSYSPKYDKALDRLIHHDCWLVETSAVTFAANPAAVIAGFKACVPEEFYLPDDSALAIEGMAKLFKAASEGRVPYPLQRMKRFFVSGFKPLERTASLTDNNPIRNNGTKMMTVLSHDKSHYAVRAAGDPTVRNSENKDREFLVRHDAGADGVPGYSLRVARSTPDGGVAYDFEDVAKSAAWALGAKAGAVAGNVYAEVYADVVTELSEIYEKLGKRFPTVAGKSAAELTSPPAFSDVEFHEGEKAIAVSASVIEHADALQGALKHLLAIDKEYAKSEIFRSKDAFGYVSFYFSVYPETADDIAMIQSLLEVLRAYFVPAEQAVTTEATDPESFKRRLADALQAVILGAPSLESEVEVEATPTPEVEVEVETKVGLVFVDVADAPEPRKALEFVSLT